VFWTDLKDVKKASKRRALILKLPKIEMVKIEIMEEYNFVNIGYDSYIKLFLEDSVFHLFEHLTFT